jgi:hypothetical protein
MKGFFATAVVAASLLALAPTQASAWACRADGWGSWGWARSFSIERAKFVALRRCERGSALHVCTISWCRP